MIDNKKLEQIANNVKIIDIYTEMFRKGDFSFIVEGEDEDGNTVTHEKQRQALEILTSGKYDEFLYGGSAGGAKAQAMDSKIYTPFGYKLMKDIKIGDVIKHPSGCNTNVIGVHPQGIKKLYEVEFIDGAKTKCCGDHLWNVWYASDLSKQEKKTGKGKIQTTEMLINNLHRNPIIPLSKPVQFTKPINRYITPIWDKIHPYIFGCLLGDGGLTKQLGFTTSDEEILDHIRQRLPKKYTINNLKGDYAYSITQNERNKYGYPINDLYALIKELKLDCKSEHKFIPNEFMHSTLKTRIALAQGLMDTDGTIDKRGHCSFSSSSERLALDFQYILRSLGFKVTKRTKKTTHLDSYRLYIVGSNTEMLFKLKRKKEKSTMFNGGYSELGRRIISIKETGYEEAQCITVDANDGLYITDDFIVTHNTWTGCVWLLFMGICYPGIKSFIGRNELKDILDSVYVTFCKVARAYGFTDFKFNAVKNFIQFGNGSHINLIEVKYKPSDKMYEDVGSTEYTIGWGEEIGEWHETAATVLASRVGRHLNKKDINGKIRKKPIKGTVLWTCNPKNNWGKREFYNKAMNGTLEPNKAYLQCLVTENPFIEKEYIEKLKKIGSKNKALYERLFKGNWNYVENPYQLPEQEMIESIFSNDQSPEGKGYITADVARFGSDKARIGYWSGWRLKEVISLDISKTTDVELAIKTLRYKYKVPRTRCIVDQDGVGGGVVDGVGAIGFKNNGRAIRKGKDTPNYKNLQVQCLYKLADRINEGFLYIEADMTGAEKEEIKEELAQIQSKGDPDPERKLDCKAKGDIKQDIGRSPDWRDMFMMRVFFDLKSNTLELTSNWS